VCPFLKNKSLLHHPRDSEEQNADDDFDNQKIEAKDSVEEANQQCVQDKEHYS